MAADWPLATLVKPPSEVFHERAPVSAGYIRGVEIINADEKSAEKRQDLKSLYVRLRKSRPLDLCVQLVTRDGRYTAIHQYRLPETTQESYAQINVAGQSRYPEVYRQVSPRDFAVVARSGVCPADGGPVIPVFWNSPPLETAPRTLVIAVQTGDREATLYLGGKTAHQPGLPCAEVADEHVAAFDALCMHAAGSDSNMLELPIDVETCEFHECDILQRAKLLQ
jgi:hypothetical protein